MHILRLIKNTFMCLNKNAYLCLWFLITFWLKIFKKKNNTKNVGFKNSIDIRCIFAFILKHLKHFNFFCVYFSTTFRWTYIFLSIGLIGAVLYWISSSYTGGLSVSLSNINSVINLPNPIGTIAPNNEYISLLRRLHLDISSNKQLELILQLVSYPCCAFTVNILG